jgi:hypothetical protein
MTYECDCGWKFANAGEFRSSEAFTTNTGESGVICPDCGKHYIGDQLVIFEDNENEQE